ncbi:hypothetical protein [Clostridium botulinum]
MIITASMDNNVTWSKTMDYLREIGILNGSEERKFDKENKTLFINIEVNNSIVGDKLKEIGKANVYVKIINEKGIGLFSIDDNSNIQCFFPMSNVISISF